MKADSPLALALHRPSGRMGLGPEPESRFFRGSSRASAENRRFRLCFHKPTHTLASKAEM